MKYFSVLIKPASICNLNCSYCFYNDVTSHNETPSCSMMSEETMTSIILKSLSLFNEPVQITYAFQGGEPTCAGLQFFEKFTQLVDENKKDYHQIHYALQTNGTLLDSTWIPLFKTYHFLIGVSLDGFLENHNHFRKDKNENDTFDQVMNSITLLKNNNIETNILTVLTSELALYPERLYEFYQAHNIDYIQLIPCLPDLNHKDSSYSLTPQKFASFYKVFFDLWYKDYLLGNYRSVTFFDNIIPLFLGVPPQQCGYLGFCRIQFVIEADGSVYPCDFYTLDQYKMGNINHHDFKELFNSTVAQNFLKEPNRSSPLCKTCQFERLCHGNCKRLNITYFNSEYCGLQDFLSSKENEISNLIKLLK